MKLLAVLAFIVTLNFNAFATIYDVGPGRTYQELHEVPWESLFPGDLVEIHWRALPYRGKMVLCRIGTQALPIVVRGVPSETGELPIIDGEDAVTSTALNFWNEERGIIKIGGANKPADTMPEYIRIESLEIRNGRPGFTFTGRNGLSEYVNNAAAVYIEKGKHITISGCVLHDCGNGIFAGSLTEDLVIEYCWIYNNGIENSLYEHNTYTEARGIIYQYNHFGSLRANCLGNNLKDRSAGTVVRYNWIENGNRQLDLVDSGDEDFYNSTEYRSTYVYANILIEGDNEGNSQIIHYGGDSGNEERYRKGTLYLYNNTIVSTRAGNTTLLRMPTQFESCEAFNNIIYVTAAPSRLAVVSTDDGVMRMDHNFMRPGWRIAHGSTLAQTDILNTVTAEGPGFTDFESQDFTLTENSPCVDAGLQYTAPISPNYIPVEEYRKHRDARIRESAGLPDIGAFERPAFTSIYSPDEGIPDVKLMTMPNPFTESLQMTVWGAQRVLVYSVTGELVQELSVAQSASMAPVSVAWTPAGMLPAGIYVIHAEGETGTVTKKVRYMK